MSISRRNLFKSASVAAGAVAVIASPGILVPTDKSVRQQREYFDDVVYRVQNKLSVDWSVVRQALDVAPVALALEYTRILYMSKDARQYFKKEDELMQKFRKMRGIV